MSDEGERLASLEAHAQEATKQRDAVFDKLQRQDQDLAAIRTDVHAIKVAVASYKSFFAGFSFAVAALGGLVGAFLTAVWNRLFP
jgi:L-rhamnose isomerase